MRAALGKDNSNILNDCGDKDGKTRCVPLGTRDGGPAGPVRVLERGSGYPVPA
jgi:hypothetical protein